MSAVGNVDPEAALGPNLIGHRKCDCGFEFDFKHIGVTGVICEELTEAIAAAYIQPFTDTCPISSPPPADPERDSRQMEKQAIEDVTWHSLPG